MVIDYPENGTRELLARERLHESVQLWAGTPLTFIHPENEEKTADKPESFTREVIGQVFRPEIVDDEKLKVQAWLDIQKALDIGGLAADVVERLRSGENLSVSAGYATIDDAFVGGSHNGDSYDVEQGMVLPDHVAIFPSDEFKARCDWEDGCGAPRANYVEAPSDVESTENSCDCSHAVDTDPLTLRQNVESVVQSYVTTNALEEARTPTYEELTSADWEPPSFTEYVQEWAERTDSEFDDRITLDNVPDQAKQFAANRTLVGDPDADQIGDVVAYPVVNTDDELNENALHSARRLAGHSNARDSIQAEAEDLLESAPEDGEWPSGRTYDFSDTESRENAQSGEYVAWMSEEGERYYGLTRERITEPNLCREINGTVRCATEDRNVLIIERVTEVGEGLQEFHIKFEDTVEPWSGGSTAAGSAMNAADESGVASSTDQDMTEPDEDPATLFAKFMRSLGMDGADAGGQARANAASDSTDTESGDDEPDTDDAETSVDAEDTGSEESNTTNTEDEETDTMGDNDPDDDKQNQQSLSVEDLAEHTMFSVETLEQMDEEMLETLESEVIQTLLGSSQEAEEMGEERENTEDDETEGSSTEQTTEETVTNNEDFVTEEQLDSRLDEFEENVTNSFEETLEEQFENFSEQKENAQKREQQARIVADSIEGMTVNAAKELPDEELADLAEKHGGSQMRANMAAVPGQMDRTLDEKENAEEVDYPTGGRSGWEQRQKEGGD